jgi:hypothetical protein
MNPRTATIVLTLSLTGTALAGNNNDWIGSIGDWTNPANWSQGMPPGVSEYAIIANGGVAEIDGLDLTLGSGIIGTTLDGRFGMGELIQRGGTTNWNGFGSLLLARDKGSFGALTLTDGAQLNTQFALEIGWQGHAEAYINQGSIATVDQLIVAGRRYAPGRTFSATASLDVAGQGTLIRTTTDSNANGMVIGAGGSAQVTIRDGARIETTDALLLSTTSEGSNLIIEGPDSSLQVSGGFFDTGRDITLPDDHPPVGDAVLTLRNGGTLDASNTSRAMVLFSQTRIEGTGTLMGDAYFYQGSTIDPGEHNEYGHLSFTHQLDSVLDFNSNITGGTFHFDIGSINDFDQLTVHDLIAGGTLEVGIADDFVAQFGQSFDIITADFISGDFDLIALPELQGSLSFEIEIHTQGVTLHVVPAPSSLIAIALPMLVLNRRRT